MGGGADSDPCRVEMANTDAERGLLAERARASLLQDELADRSKRVAELERDLARLSRRVDGNDALFTKLSSTKRELLSARQDVDFERGLRLQAQSELRSAVEESDALRSKNRTLEFFIGAHVKETADASVQTEPAADATTRAADGAPDGAGERGVARHAATTELCAQLKRVEQKLVDPGDSRWVGYARSTLQCDAQLYAVFVQLERLVRAKRLALRTTPTA